MRRVLLLLLGATAVGAILWVGVQLILSGAPAAKPSPPAPEPSPAYALQHPPRHSVIFIISPSSLAHGCPVTLASGDYVLTSRHVIYDNEAKGLMGARWGEEGGASGRLRPIIAYNDADIGMFAFEGTARPNVMHRISVSAPAPHETVWMFGYDWVTFTEKPLAVNILGVVAGHFIGDATAGPGSSGSCILDEKGEVIGINSWQIGSASGMRSVGPAVFGQWMPE